MKKILGIIINFFTDLLKTFFKKGSHDDLEKREREEVCFYNKKIMKKDEETDSSEGTRNLFKEHVRFKKFSHEDIKIELNKVLEKIFKVKIRHLSRGEKTSLEKYTKKIILKLEKVEIKNKEDLREFLEINVKKDKERNISKKEEKIKEKEVNETLNVDKNVFIPEVIDAKEDEIEEAFEEKRFNTVIKEHYPEYKKDVISEAHKDIMNKKEGKLDDVILKEESVCSVILSKEEKNDEFLEKKDSNWREDLQGENFLEAKIISSNLAKEDNIKQNNDKLKFNTKQKEVLKAVPEKEMEYSKNLEKIMPEVINFSLVKIENDQVIDKAKKEMEKEDLVDKEYELVEELLDERIIFLEDLLLKDINEEQKVRVKDEIKKLKDIKNKVYIFKEKDLEDLRISLEESISEEELEQLKLKFKKYQEDNKLKQKEILILNATKKSQKKIEEMEILLLKQALKKSFKKLELPLFLSFPFIKNKFFRHLVSGLFVFRSLQFIKNILFGSAIEQEGWDFLEIKKGNDALEEAILLMYKNIVSFKELKKQVFLKYPELINDEEFLIYINNLEKSLQKRYENLQKQDKVVKKYFNKAKVLVRKKKI